MDRAVGSRDQGGQLPPPTVRTWWQDPTRKMDLNLVNIKDIPCTSETIWWMTSLGREEMPNVVGIDEFDYKPKGDRFKVALEGGKAKEAPTKDAEATPTARDPIH